MEHPSKSRTGNKVRTYILYAIGEIALVMIGILLALQVNNWNEQRINDKKEREYMVQLLEDAREDSVFFENRVAILEQDRRAWIALVFEENLHWSDSVQVALSDSTILFWTRTVHESFLINNNPNPFENIESKTIKETLRRYQNTHNYLSQAMELKNRIIEEYGVPLQLKYSIQLNKVESGKLSITDASIFLKSQDIQAAIGVFLQFNDVAIIQIPSFLEQNHLLIQQLEQELGSS